MAFDKNQRERIWVRYNGSSYSATDVFGRSMNFDNFEADHIWPESHGGSSTVENGIPLASLSNQEKADDTEGYVNGRSFRVTAKKRNPNVGNLYVNGRLVSK